MKDKIAVPRFNKDNGFATTPQRSNLMSKIKGKDTKPEILLRKALWKFGVRFRLHSRLVVGKPDIVVRIKRLAVFIDGDFWHGRNWQEKKFKIKTNREFWIAKIERNMQRDSEINSLLKLQGWTVVRFWESDIKKDVDKCVSEVMRILTPKAQ